MSLTPKDIADQLLDGKEIKQHLSASDMDDVVWNVSRKLEGEEGFRLLISSKVYEPRFGPLDSTCAQSKSFCALSNLFPRIPSSFCPFCTTH